MVSQQQLRERLLRNIEIIPFSGCWIWLGCVNRKGYGQIRVRPRPLMLAHRASFEAFNGEVQHGKCVLHRCDVPPCINPVHLFLGTVGENNTDMRLKGRMVFPETRCGEANNLAQLTEEQVMAIYAATGKQSDIARLFGTTQAHVSRIKLRQAWGHLWH